MIRMIRNASHAGRSYRRGDAVEDHDVAGMFVRLGFAAPEDQGSVDVDDDNSIDDTSLDDESTTTSDDAVGIADPTAADKPRRPRRGQS